MSSILDTYLGKTQLWRSPEHPVPVDYADLPNGGDYLKLREACRNREEESGRSSFGLLYEGIRYRVSAINSIYDYVYTLRKAPEQIPPLDTLDIPKFYLSKLMQKHITGLVLVTGATGSGKTTTVSSCIVERLKLFGGLAVSCEDPPELPLEGRHGNGIMFQSDVDKFGSFANAMRDAVRWTPDIIFLGEIRDYDTALEALRAGVNGHLIFATVHAGDCISALHRIKSFAPDAQSNELNNLLADGLAAVLHQSLTRSNGVFKMDTTLLSFIPDNQGSRNQVRSGKFEQLKNNIIDNQNKSKFMTSGD